jgi:hypothetical protein
MVAYHFVTSKLVEFSKIVLASCLRNAKKPQKRQKDKKTKNKKKLKKTKEP